MKQRLISMMLSAKVSLSTLTPTISLRNLRAMQGRVSGAVSLYWRNNCSNPTFAGEVRKPRLSSVRD